MKKLEKILKQKLSNNVEINLNNYHVEYNLNKVKNTKQVSKNQYKLLNINQLTKDIDLKYPIRISIVNDNSSIEISKKNKLIIPEYFRKKEKSFCYTSSNTIQDIVITASPVFMLCKILYSQESATL